MILAHLIVYPGGRISCRPNRRHQRSHSLFDPYLILLLPQSRPISLKNSSREVVTKQKATKSCNAHSPDQRTACVSQISVSLHQFRRNSPNDDLAIRASAFESRISSSSHVKFRTIFEYGKSSRMIDGGVVVSFEIGLKF